MSNKLSIIIMNNTSIHLNNDPLNLMNNNHKFKLSHLIIHQVHAILKKKIYIFYIIKFILFFQKFYNR